MCFCVCAVAYVSFISISLRTTFLFLCNLGENRSWEKFEDSYKVMVFANGDKCWNGPDRSLKVVIIMLLHIILRLLLFNETRIS